MFTVVLDSLFDTNNLLRPIVVAVSMPFQDTDQDTVNLPLKTLLEGQGIAGLGEFVTSMFDPWHWTPPHSQPPKTTCHGYTFSTILCRWFLRVPSPRLTEMSHLL